MDVELERKLAACSSLPTLPAVAIEILHLCQVDEPEPLRIAGAFSRDPALAAKLLKAVNSPLFGLRHEVRTIQHAVILLGSNAVCALALSFSLVRQKGNNAGRIEVWRRSLVAAIAARELALQSRFPAPDEAFLAALLQEIGVLALAQTLGAPYEALLLQHADHEALVLAERELLGADHGEAGAWLLRRWRLPEGLCTAVSCSHKEYAPAGTTEDGSTLAALTAAAGAVAGFFSTTPAAQTAAVVQVKAATLLSLPAGGLEWVLGRVGKSVPELAPLFDLTFGTADEVNRVLEMAKDALVALTMRAGQGREKAEQAMAGVLRTVGDRAPGTPAPGTKIGDRSGH